MKRVRCKWFGSLLALVLGCASEPHVELPPLGNGSAPVETPADAQVRTAECDQAIDGTPCGKPGQGTHCAFNACIRNACGDGIRAQEEECDDGNERSEDGCNARCQVQIPGCTNGQKETGEECDDGNRDNGDSCTNRCTVARCGDTIKGPGEACDDGNTREEDGCTQSCSLSSDGGAKDASTASGDAATTDAGLDAGSAEADASEAVLDASKEAGSIDSGTRDAAYDAEDASSPDTGNPYDAGPECMACRVSHCSDFMGTNLVKGCMQTLDSAWVTSPSDPTFLQQCIDILACAQAHDCAYSAAGPLACYCGDNDLDKCASAGPSSNAPCRQQWLAGSRTSTNAEALGNVTDLQFPSAWAFYLLDCEREACKTLCQ